VVAGLVLGTSLATVAHAREQAITPSLAAVSLAELPAQAQETHRLVLKGGPFSYPKDGISFGNRERQLPPKARGYYHEYTVKTPGSRDRGARRIVCGGEPPTQPEVCYYTDDHYSSFRRIAP
jgi:ribonuclease T1